MIEDTDKICKLEHSFRKKNPCNNNIICNPDDNLEIYVACSNSLKHVNSKNKNHFNF